MESGYKTTMKVQQMLCKGQEYRPEKEVTILLANPEQALKNNLKPIKTAY